MTEKLYYQSSYIREFEAKVLSCEACKDGFEVITDKTAFFPEGGGQPSDIGTLGTARVLWVHETDGVVYHLTDDKLTIGSTVCGSINYDRRFRFMQNHGGEHIVSGIVNSMFSLDNVGFHMGTEDITIDYNGFLDRQQLRQVEHQANMTVYRNLPVIASFPSANELASLYYRSKKAIDGNLRIVTIKGCDACACCAPHLSATGEIGVIKILDSFRYKGGVRVHLLCGLDALDDYNKKYDAVRTVAGALSVTQNETAQAFSRFEAEFADCRATASALKAEILRLKTEKINYTQGNLCLFEKDLSGDDLRKFALAASDKCGGVCAVFSGTEQDYCYVIVSRTDDLRKKSVEINAALSGRGGGSSEMLQGRAACTAETAKEYFLKDGKCI